MKKIIIAVIAAVFWIVSVTVYAVAASGEDYSDHEFTVLAVKDKSTNDYNSMPVFKQLAKETRRDVYWTFNTSLQFSNNPDPLSIKGIDAIYNPGFSNLALYKYGSRGRIVAIDKYLDSMPTFKAILENRPDVYEALKSPDGHVYSLPRVEEMGLQPYPNILFLNKAWVEKLMDWGKMPAELSHLTKNDLADGLDLSREEFKLILQKFNEEDMDGDGNTKNEMPLMFVSGNWQGNESDFISSFGVPENTQHKTVLNGKITFTFEDERWFEAVCEINEWHREGLIRSEAFNPDQNEFLAKGQDGSYGAFYWWEKRTVAANSDDYIIVRPLKDENGNRYVGLSNKPEVEKSACVVLSSCRDIKGLLSYFDNFFKPDYSAQMNYGSIDSGAFLKEKQDGKLIPNDDHGAQSADDFRNKNAPYGVMYLDENVWEESVEMESRAQTRLDWLERFVKPYTYKGAEVIPNLNYTVEELNTLNTYESSLNINVSAWYSAAALGDSAPTRESWQELLSKNATSIAKIKETNQAAYDRYIAATEG